MARVQEKIARRAAARLEPGESVQVAVPAQASVLPLLLMFPVAMAVLVGLGSLGVGGALGIGLAVAAGGCVAALCTPYLSIVVTDRRIVVFRSGTGGASPTTILAAVPRATRLGPPRGLWYRPPLPVKALVAWRFCPDLRRADSYAAAFGTPPGPRAADGYVAGPPGPRPGTVPQPLPYPLPYPLQQTPPPMPPPMQPPMPYPPQPGPPSMPPMPYPPQPGPSPMPPGTAGVAPAAGSASVGRTLAVIAVALLAVPAVILGVAGVVVAVRGDPPAAPGRSAAPTVDGPRRAQLTELMRGDCFTLDGALPAEGETARIGAVETIACTQPHNREVVTVLAYPGITWEDGGETRANEHCASAFTSDVRADVAADSRYAASYIRTHVAGDGGTGRTLFVLCVVASTESTTGSVLT